MRWVAATLTLVAIAVTSAIALAFAWGGLSTRAAATSLVLGLGAATIAFLTTGDKNPRRLTPWDITLLIIFALASLRAFLWLLYPVGDEWRVLSPYNLGDLSKHIQIIRYLANGAPFWPESPFFTRGSLSYYIGVDFFNSILLSVGVPLQQGLVWSGLIGASLTAWALWRWGGAFTLAMLLFNGGLAGGLILQTGVLEDFQSGIAWKNLFLTMFVTQRPLLYAIPGTFLVLTVIRDDMFRSPSGVPTWIVWLIYATMPVFSLHAFAFLSFTLLGIFILRPESRAYLFRFIRAALLPATILVFFVTGAFTQETGGHWQPGWMQGNAEWTIWLKDRLGLVLQSPVSEILFWLVNFGVALPLLFLVVWKTVKDRDAESASFAGVGIIVFVVCCFFSFAPWDWDNTKFFIWAWLACAPYVWGTFSSSPAVVRMVLCFFLFASGAMSLAAGLDKRHGYKLVGRSELASMEIALAHVPPLDRIATEPTHTNPVMLLGRPVVCGYEGMLWAHGLDYGPTYQNLKEVIEGRDPDHEKAKVIGADWVVIAGQAPLKIK